MPLNAKAAKLCSDFLDKYTKSPPLSFLSSSCVEIFYIASMPPMAPRVHATSLNLPLDHSRGRLRGTGLLRRWTVRERHLQTCVRKRGQPEEFAAATASVLHRISPPSKHRRCHLTRQERPRDFPTTTGKSTWSPNWENILRAYINYV